jgi:hypothetical protein
MGFSEGVIGYLPYHDEVKEGGYEVDSSVNYGWDSCINEGSLCDFFDELKIFITETVA